MSTPFKQQMGSSGSSSGGKKPKKKDGLFGSLLGGGKTYFILAIVAALAAGLASFAILGQSAERSTYYVLSQDVAARTQILPDMLMPVETASGTAPQNALTPAEVTPMNALDEATGEQVGVVFAKYPMQKGDVVTPSNSGPLERIDTNLPPNYVVTSFRVAPENAVAGKVRSGDLVDVFATDQSETEGTIAKLVLHRLLVIDVTVDPSTIAKSANDTSVQSAGSTAPGPESAQVRGGIPYLYTVAVTPEDAAKIAIIRDQGILVALSSNDAAIDTDVSTSQMQVFGTTPVGDSSAGLDLAADENADGTVLDENGQLIVEGEVSPTTADSMGGTLPDTQGTAPATTTDPSPGSVAPIVGE